MHPNAADSLNYPPPPLEEAEEAAQTYYLSPQLYPNHYSSPYPNPNPLINPNPDPYSADATSAESFGNAAYYAQQPMYATADTDATPGAAGYYQDSNAYNNWLPYDAGVATNGMQQLVATQANPIAPETASKKIIRKKQKVPVKPVQCEVCKVECTSEEVLRLHREGKNHKKNLETLKATLAPALVAPSELPNNPVFSSQAQQMCCEVCKIECNSKEMLEAHEQGKKHKKNIEKMKTTSAPAAPVAIIGPQENAKKRKLKANESEDDLKTKKKKVVENGTVVDVVKRCEICNVVCNSDLVLESHLAGQKHLALVKKHLAQEAEELEPKKEEVVGKTEDLEPKKEKIVGKTEDLETKMKKVVDNGTSVDAVKTCKICDIVCNSDLVFRYHLAGKKHMAMVKKGKAEAQVTTEC